MWPLKMAWGQVHTGIKCVVTSLTPLQKSENTKPLLYKRIQGMFDISKYGMAFIGFLQPHSPQVMPQVFCFLSFDSKMVNHGEDKY